VACHVLRTVICRELATAVSLEDRLRAVDRAVARANAALRIRAAREGLESLETTVSVLVVGCGSDGVRKAAVGWVGDGRIYRIRNGCMECLTRDHSVRDVLPSLPPSLRCNRARA